MSPSTKVAIGRDVLPPSAREVVEDVNLVAPRDQGVGDVRADEACPAGDDDAHVTDRTRTGRMTKRQRVRSQCSWREIPRPGSHRAGCGRRSRRRSRERLLRGRPGPAGEPGGVSGDTGPGPGRPRRGLGIPSGRDDGGTAGPRSDLRRRRARARAAEAEREELHRDRRRHGRGARGSPGAARASDRFADESDDGAARDRGRGARPEDQGSEGGNAGRAEQGGAARRPLVSAPAAALLGASWSRRTTRPRRSPSRAGTAL